MIAILYLIAIIGMLHIGFAVSTCGLIFRFRGLENKFLSSLTAIICFLFIIVVGVELGARAGFGTLFVAFVISGILSGTVAAIEMKK